ncbi:DUF1287 domain-containing protein [Rhizobium sp.]
MLSRRHFVSGSAATLMVAAAAMSRETLAAPAPDGPWSTKLVRAAESQIGVTTLYDAAYSRIDYPGGDVPRERGVCTDVIIRAYRDGLGIDLQKRVHQDMRRAFFAYPKLWGLKATDRNIDHRRVPNLRAFFQRQGAALPATAGAGNYKAGDVVSQVLPNGLPHIGIVSDRMNSAGDAPLVIHNIGRGTLAEDILFALDITGHYRFAG